VPKPQNYERWLGRNGAMVVCSYTERGNLKIEALLDVPHGTTGGYHSESKIVPTVEAGWEWIRSKADVWSEETGVELYGGSR
jgi:hypothetical protein